MQTIHMLSEYCNCADTHQAIDLYVNDKVTGDIRSDSEKAEEQGSVFKHYSVSIGMNVILPQVVHLMDGQPIH